MLAREKPGCWGVAARLPKKPGIQKLTPPSSANATVGTAITALRNADAKAPISTRRRIVGSFMSAPRGSVSACRDLPFQPSPVAVATTLVRPEFARMTPTRACRRQDVGPQGNPEIQPFDGGKARFFGPALHICNRPPLALRLIGCFESCATMEPEWSMPRSVKYVRFL
jgi:hypothetical protein